MRPLTRLLALLVAVALVGLGVVLAIEVVAAGIGADPVVIPWHGAYAAGRRDTWDSTGVVVISAALLAGGLVLLLSQLARRRLAHRPLTERYDGVRSSVTTAGVRRGLTAAARSVDGVAASTTVLRRRSARVRTTARGTGQPEIDHLHEQVTAAAAGWLEALSFERPPGVSVSVRPRKGSS